MNTLSKLITFSLPPEVAAPIFDANEMLNLLIWRETWGRSPDATEQTFEVGGFGEGEEDGVVGRLAQRPYNLGVPPRVYGRAPHHLLKQIRTHQTGAGERRQQAARPQQPHPQPVEVFVAPAGALYVALGVGKFGGVEDNHV